MQAAMKTEPLLRFREYVGNWPEVRLHDLLIPTLRAVPKPKDKFLAVGVRSHCRGTFQRESLDPADISMDTLYVVRQGDLIVNITFAWEGAIAIAKAEDDGGLVSHRFPTYVFNEEITGPNFFQHVFIQGRFRYFLKVISPGGAGRNRVLNKKDFLKLAVRLPERPEQEDIAAFLSAVDEKIRQLARKQELLLRYKKGVMRQIFDQRIRFSHESGNDYLAWTEVTIGELGEIVTGKTPDTLNDSLWKGDIPFITPTDIDPEKKYQGESQKTVKRREGMKVLPPGTILFTCIASIGKIGLTTCPSVSNQQINAVIPGEAYDNEFIYYALLNEVPYIKSTRASTTLPIINKREFTSLTISVPQARSEQKKIAAFLCSIDNKIQALNLQIEKTKTFKNGLLQQLFV